MQVVNGYCFYKMLLQEQNACTKSCTYFSLWVGAQTICSVYPYPCFYSLFHVLSMFLGYFIFCSLTWVLIYKSLDLLILWKLDEVFNIDVLMLCTFKATFCGFKRLSKWLGPLNSLWVPSQICPCFFLHGPWVHFVTKHRNCDLSLFISRVTKG